MDMVPYNRQEPGHENLVSNATNLSSTRREPHLALEQRLGAFTCGREQQVTRSSTPDAPTPFTPEITGNSDVWFSKSLFPGSCATHELNKKILCKKRSTNLGLSKALGFK